MDHHKPGSRSAAHSAGPAGWDGNALPCLSEEREASRIKNTNKDLMYFVQSTGLSLALGQLGRKLDREGVPVAVALQCLVCEILVSWALVVGYSSREHSPCAFQK